MPGGTPSWGVIMEGMKAKEGQGAEVRVVGATLHPACSDPRLSKQEGTVSLITILSLKSQAGAVLGQMSTWKASGGVV